MSDAPPIFYRAEALCRVTSTRPDLLRRLEKASVIARSGVDGEKRPLYGPDAVARVQRVRELLNAGYPEKDVAVVLGLVTRPTDTARRVFVTLPDVAESPSDGAATRGVDVPMKLAPDALRDDGVPMYDARRAGRLACAVDLVQLGLTHLADALTTLGEGSPVPPTLVAQIRDAIEARKRTVNRLARAIERVDAKTPPRRWRRRTPSSEP